MAAANSMQAKIDFIKKNAAASPIDQRPIVFSQTEINAYFAQSRVKLPEGIKFVTFALSRGEVMANMRADFDEITASARSRHPLLTVFSGVHDVQVTADAEGSGHIAHVNVRSATIDGISVPKMALEMFIEKWVNPKYPNIRLNGEYRLPTKIDTVGIEHRRGIVTQK